jgi:geranylgeranyl diphosphate synthase, type I
VTAATESSAALLGPLAEDRRIMAVHEAVAPLMHQAVLGLRPAIRDLALEHLGWDGTPGARVWLLGKGLRSLFALVAADMTGGSPGAGLHAAACVELVHESGLAHDDFMDGDRIRRGRPAIWATHGVPAAMLLGTALSTLGLQLLEEEPPTRRHRMAALWAAAMQDLVAGQARDLELATSPAAELDPADWERMAERKTGALFGAAMAMGAVAGGADEPTVLALDHVGRLLGVAYQIADDILAVWGDPAVTGKPAVALPSGRLYPVVAVADRLGGGVPAETRIPCRTLLDGTPARERSVAAIRRLTGRALALLAASPDRSGSGAGLRAMVSALVDRQR